MKRSVTVVPRVVLIRPAAILLGVASAVWCAVPLPRDAWSGFVLFLVIVCVSGGALRLALAEIPIPEDTFLLSAPLRAGASFLRFIRVPPWEEGAVATALWLEVLHSSRPWHTGILGLVLTAYLLTVHLAESGSPLGVLWSQGPVLAGGVCLLALGAGIGMLPAVTPGPGAALLRVVAAIAALAAAGLVLPHAQVRSRS